MGNIGTTATLLLIVVLFLAGISIIGDDISNNTNLDNASKSLLSDLGTEYNDNYNAGSSFTTTENNITVNSSFASTDAFSRQFLEDKSTIAQKKSTTDKILGFPSLFLKMFGVENETILNLWSTAIYSFIAFLLGLQLYKAVRTGEVD